MFAGSLLLCMLSVFFSIFFKGLTSFSSGYLVTILCFKYLTYFFNGLIPYLWISLDFYLGFDSLLVLLLGEIVLEKLLSQWCAFL